MCVRVCVHVCVCVCVCVLTGMTLTCKAEERNDWVECSRPHTEHVHLMNNYHSLLLPVSLSLSLLPLLTLCFLTSSFHYNSIAFPRCPSTIGIGAVILSAHRQPIDSPIFARPWTNACMPISLFSSLLSPLCLSDSLFSSKYFWQGG